VDIASGSPLSKQAPSYALFIISGDGEERHPMVSRQKLIRMIRQRAPEIVAVDNVHELAADRSDLVWLLRQMPPGTRVVQVTGGERAASWEGRGILVSSFSAFFSALPTKIIAERDTSIRIRLKMIRRFFL